MVAHAISLRPPAVHYDMTHFSVSHTVHGAYMPLLCLAMRLNVCVQNPSRKKIANSATAPDDVSRINFQRRQQKKIYICSNALLGGDEGLWHVSLGSFVRSMPFYVMCTSFYSV